MDEDEYRRERIAIEVIADCYDDGEISNAWETYMFDALISSFKARIINNSSEIPAGEIIVVTEMLDDFDIEGSVGWLKNSANLIEEVQVQWNDKEFYIAVENLEALDKNIQTLEAIKDWNFWIRKY